MEIGDSLPKLVIHASLRLGKVFGRATWPAFRDRILPICKNNTLGASTQKMNWGNFRNLFACAVIAFLASGCVSLPKQQAFNRQAHQDIKSIAVLPTHETHVQIWMMHHPGASFGLIGGMIAAADMASKRDRYNAIISADGFDALAYFKQQLDARMSEHGYILVWPDAQVETGELSRGSFGLRKTYGSVPVDAQLDVNFGFLGYAASGASDKSPYRPTVTIGARLVSADGKQNLFTDYIYYNNIFNVKTAITIEASAGFSYPDFDSLEAAGRESIDGLKAAIDAIAAEVARQL